MKPTSKYDTLLIIGLLLVTRSIPFLVIGTLEPFVTLLKKKDLKSHT